MVMRDVKPLSDRQWAMVIEQLEKGPTPEMIRLVERARESSKHVREISHEEYMERRRRNGTA